MNKKNNTFSGFTLAEVLITLGVIGVVAALTVPTIMQNASDKELVTKLLKFNSTLSQAVQLWKQDIGCNDSAYKCLNQQNLPDNTISNFDQIAKFLKVSASRVGEGANTETWLPEDIYLYNGDVAASDLGNISHTGAGHGAFLLQDGTTFSLDADPNGFAIIADVNGSKKPNRIGKDIYFLTIGEFPGKDIYYNAYWWNNADGLCQMETLGASDQCDPDNLDPSVGDGASPTAYAILNGKLPNFDFGSGGGGRVPE